MRQLILGLSLSLFSLGAWAAAGVGGGGGGDRPGYAPAAYSKSSLCDADEWRVRWEMRENDRTREFYSCEKRPIKLASYIYNPDNRCKETGKAQPRMDSVPGSDRYEMRWEICKNGKYVLYKP